MTGQININFKNCRNIASVKDGGIPISPNKLNVIFAANGTGKTTFAKVCEYLSSDTKSKTEVLERLKSFKYLANPEDTDLAPSITDSKTSLKVATFNEEWVESHCFQPDSLRDNTFKLFVESAEYRSLASKRDEAIGILLSTVNGEGISKLIGTFNSVTKGTGSLTKSNEFNRASAVANAYQNGSPLGDIPGHLNKVIDSFPSVKRAQWAQWHMEGKQYTSRDNLRCPYCGNGEDDTIDQCLAYDENLTDKSLKAWLKVSTAIGEHASLFDPQAIHTIEAVLSADHDPTDEDNDRFKQLAKEVTNTAATLSQLRNISVTGQYNSPEVHSTLKTAREAITLPSQFFSEDVKKLINEALEAIDTALQNFEKIESLANEQNELIARAVRSKENEFNTFLEEAGYPYKIEISLSDKDEAALILKDANTAHPASKTKECLSYGERNAITLILFLYEVLESKPDLIIFDDPISSFDGDKRFAILYTLFSENQKLIAENLFEKTTIILTHDLLIVSDLFRVVRDSLEIPRISGMFLRVDDQGILSRTKITRNDVESYPRMIGNKAQTSTDSFIKLVYARRYIELMKGVDDTPTSAWHILSSLFHKKSQVRTLKGEPLGDNEYTQGIGTIEKLIGESFDYKNWHERIKDGSQYLIERYNDENLSPYERLQVVRILIINNEDKLFENDKTIQIRYADETYHLGGDYLFQLDPNKFQQTPNNVEKWCNSVIDEYKTMYSMS